jgi:predicted Zn finger-like uncharacterized protein
MVIVCPECSTKFRVNPERIPESGAKVRCARCKHIFIATKPIAAESAPEISPAEQQPAMPAAVEEPTIPPPLTAQIEKSSSDNDNEESSFSYDQFRDMDTTKAEDDDFSFGDQKDDQSASEPEQEESAASEAMTADSGEDDTFSFSGTTAASAEADDDSTDDAAESAAAQESAFAAEADDQLDAEIPPVVAADAKSSPKTSLARILMLLILGLLAIGAALYYINGPEQIEQAIQQILGKQASQSTSSGQIALTNLEGKFINNQEAGELFVIRGEATNNYQQARADIQVKGVIFDQNGEPLLQKTIFCGNPINDQELQTLPFNKLEEIMGNQFGKALNNMKVNSKEAIPFTIAFRDLPKNLSEFSVDVTSSKPATE